MGSPDTCAALARIGAIAALVGAPVLLIFTLLHPLGADPNDAAAAFAEYAGSAGWTWIHLGQFLGLTLLPVALVALGVTFEPGRAAAWARIGMFGAAATVAVAAALQAVDGVALKFMVDRWAAASPEARGPVFEAAFAVRQIEIGLGSLLSLVSGLTLAAFGCALIVSMRFPKWFGWAGLLTGLCMSAAGTAQSYIGFAEPAMTVSMLASSIVAIWFVLAGLLMWRLAASNKDEN